MVGFLTNPDPVDVLMHVIVRAQTCKCFFEGREMFDCTNDVDSERDFDV